MQFPKSDASFYPVPMSPSLPCSVLPQHQGEEIQRLHSQLQRNAHPLTERVSEFNRAMQELEEQKRNDSSLSNIEEGSEQVGEWIYSTSCAWWHDMEILSALLALCEGSPPVSGGFSHKWSVM